MVAVPEVWRGIDEISFTRRAEGRRLLNVSLELDAARRASEVLFQSGSPDEVIKRALEIAVAVVNAEGGSILIADQATRELVFRHSIGIKPVAVGTVLPWDEGIAGVVYGSGEPVIIDDVQGDGRHFKGIDKVTNLVTTDMIALPLKQWRTGTIGVLEILNKRDDRFDEQDLSLLTIISAIATVAIERARLDEEVKLAELARLVAGISHDIKNLLTPIVCGSEVISDSLDQLFQKIHPRQRRSAQKTYQRSRRVVAAVEASTRHTQDRLKEITDCIRGRSLQPHFAPCALSSVIEQVFETLCAIAQQRNITLMADGLERMPEISADEGKLFTLMYNLVNNALSEVAPGGSITIRGEPAPEGNGLVIDVADTGRGMPAEIRDRLFTDKVISNHKHLGSGLGTRLVKDVIDAHGGRISVESTVDVGTTFRIFLPSKQGEA